MRRGSVYRVNLSTTHPAEFWKDEGGRPSYVVLPGIRQVFKTRLGELAGTIAEEVMQHLDDALAAFRDVQ